MVAATVPTHRLLTDFSLQDRNGFDLAHWFCQLHPGTAMMMVSNALEEGDISRRLEPKSFISKPLESKTRFIALSDGKITGRA